MTSHPTSPCTTCPFRKDAKLGHWHEDHFHMLLDAQTHHRPGMLGNTFGCHKQAALPDEKRGFCAGWLFDQKRDGVPSIMLRLRMATEPESLAAFNAVTDGGHELFDSVEEMCRVNLAVIDRQKAILRRRRRRA